jgi:hypothetical protein
VFAGAPLHQKVRNSTAKVETEELGADRGTYLHFEDMIQGLEGVSLRILLTLDHGHFICDKIDWSLLREGSKWDDLEQRDLDEIPRDDIHIVRVHTKAVGVR